MVDCGFDDQPGVSGRDLLTHNGPTLMVEIGFDPDFRPGAGIRPELPRQQYPALVDTGATESCIDSELAATLRLPIVDRQGMAGIQGKGEANMHLAQIHVPALGYTDYGKFAGVHLTAGGQPHSALIGRTFLRHFTMAYDGGTGKVTLSRLSSS